MRILNEGTRLAGRYSLIRRLGAGGMSETWLADDDHADARVVLKFLSADAAGDPRQKELMQREWRIGSRLMHANIIRVFEFHDEPEGSYFALQVMKLLSIESLFDNLSCLSILGFVITH